MSQHKFVQEFGFNEVYLNHKKSILPSRYDEKCDPSVTLGNRKFKLPVIPANMKSIVNEKTCTYLAEKELFYIMHRFQTDNFLFTESMHNKGLYSSISVGVNDDSKKELKLMKENNVVPEYITVDIANAFSEKAESMVKFIKDLFPETFLIAGNYSSEDAVIALEGWGADATKCGISNGKVCTTYHATGFSRPQFSAVLNCCGVAKKPVISDGAISDVGDIAKALVAGATMVMAGSLFSGHAESAGDVIEFNDKAYKMYFGSASYNNTQSNKNVEGTAILVEYKGEMERLLWKIEDGLRSAISYAGGTDLSCFNYVTWGVRLGGVRQ